jgi:hypothetical protein
MLRTATRAVSGAGRRVIAVPLPSRLVTPVIAQTAQNRSQVQNSRVDHSSSYIIIPFLFSSLHYLIVLCN